MTNDQVVYDYKVVDDIRAKEAELEAAIESARRSINLLKASVIRLRNTRLAYEQCETSDA
jgi:hypothetical protein